MSSRHAASGFLFSCSNTVTQTKIAMKWSSTKYSCANCRECFWERPGSHVEKVKFLSSPTRKGYILMIAWDPQIYSTRYKLHPLLGRHTLKAWDLSLVQVTQKAFDIHDKTLRSLLSQYYGFEARLKFCKLMMIASLKQLRPLWNTLWLNKYFELHDRHGMRSVRRPHFIQHTIASCLTFHIHSIHCLHVRVTFNVTGCLPNVHLCLLVIWENYTRSTDSWSSSGVIHLQALGAWRGGFSTISTFRRLECIMSATNSENVLRYMH